jgi:hypothetical protein
MYLRKAVPCSRIMHAIGKYGYGVAIKYKNEDNFSYFETIILSHNV